MIGLGFKKVVLAVAVSALAIPAVAADTMTASQPAKTSPADFTWDAGLTNLKEIRLGEVARDISRNDAVREFGKHMMRDHSKLGDQLAKIANSKELQLPNTNTFFVRVTPPEEYPGGEMIDDPEGRLRDAQMDARQLESLRGSDFDRAYAHAMVEGHEKVVEMYENAVSSLKDADLKKYAEQGLHIVRHHLQMAQKLDEEVNGETSLTASPPM